LSDIERIVNSQIKAVADYEPSVVMGDAAFTLKMAAEKVGVPFVSLVNGYMTPCCGVTRKVSPSHFAYPYSKTIPPRVFEALTRKIEHMVFRKVHAPFRRLRKKLGLSRRSYLLQELEGDFNLICDLPRFFPQEGLPANFDFVGPLFYRGDEEEVEIRRFLGDHHPAILVSTGSTGNSKMLDFFADPLFKDFRIVVSGALRCILPAECLARWLFTLKMGDCSFLAKSYIQNL